MNDDLKVFLNRFELLAEISVKVLDAYEELEEKEKLLVESCYMEDIEEFKQIVQNLNYAYDAMEEKANGREQDKKHN